MLQTACLRWGAFALLFVVACSGSATGEYSAKLEGTLTATLSGSAEAHETAVADINGHAFILSLTLPSKRAGLEKYQDGLVQISSLFEFKAGEYEALAPSVRENDPRILSVHFGGPTEVSWRAIDGTVRILYGGVPVNDSCAGEFRVRFYNRESLSDTMIVSGRFVVRR